MLSIARSRHTLSAQFLFLATNALGVMLAVSYNANTPDLYPNNAHHKVGWIATWVVSAQALVSLAGRMAGILRRDVSQRHNKEEQQAFIPISTENMAEHQRRNDEVYSPKYRHSNDSGQGTEPHTESLRSNSDSASGQESPSNVHEPRTDYDEDEDLEFKAIELSPPKTKTRSLVAKVASKISRRAWRFLLFWYNFVDRTSLILGYVALATGIVTWARFFVSYCGSTCPIRR